MPTAHFNGNTLFFTVDGVDFDAEFKSLTLERTVEVVETSRGSGRGHKQHNAGLKHTTLKATIGYTIPVSTLIAKMSPGTHYAIIIGPESNTAGKPKHNQSMLLVSAPWTIEVAKSEVAFELSFEADGDPTSDFWNGDTW